MKSVRNFIRGIASGFKAADFLLGHRQLLSTIFLPLCIHILVGLGAFFSVYWMASHWFPIALPSLEGSWDGILIFLTQSMTFLLHLGLYFFLFIFVYLFCFALVCPVFYAWMVEKFERSLGLPNEQCQSISIKAQVLDSFLLLLFFLVGHGVLFLIFWIPFIGPIVTLTGGLTFQAFCLGMESMDYSLSLRGQRFSEKLAFARQRKSLVFGIGCIPLLFIAVPVLNACLLTITILGATFIVREELVGAKNS